jgi:cation diffusion facilitator CzcD-associated flavoprotein CzcO
MMHSNGSSVAEHPGVAAGPDVVIIGAGFGGLAAAMEFKRRGISFTVLERGPSVGGVWRDNSYPGAACDVPSPIYSYASSINADWSRRFGFQPEIHAYLQRCATESGVLPHIRFDAEVISATWREGSATWEVGLADGSSVEACALVCATGQLSVPKLPELPGMESFAGTQFHSSRWDHSVSLEGKRVAVVGSGASAIQIVPAIAAKAAHVTVIQRSPNWVASKYDWPQPAILRSVMNRLPALALAEHVGLWWWFECRWPLILRKMDPVRRLIEARIKWTMRRTLREPAQVAAVTPSYPLGCNRLLLSNSWYQTLARDDVDLVAAPVVEVRPHGVVTSDGPVDADVIVWCTGFAATEYLLHVDITGRDGLPLSSAWSSGPEAYLGITTTGFPNLFMVYGPNTGSLTNTVIFMLERQAAYIGQAIEQLAPAEWMDVRADCQEQYNAHLQERLGRTVFTAGCPGWYSTDDGKVTTVWPGSHVHYARLTRVVNREAFTSGRAQVHAEPGAAPSTLATIDGQMQRG